MTKTLILCGFIIIASTSIAICAKTDEKKNNGMGTEAILDFNGNIKNDLMDSLKMCNESFRIEMTYLMTLNESGSFPDETDKTPKCFVRCVLKDQKVASEDGTLDPKRAAVVFGGARNGQQMDDIEEMTTLCVKGRNETCQCEMAYNFVKCLFSTEIERYTPKTS